MNGKEKLPKCVICKTVIDFDDEGGHIYPDVSVTCALCEETDVCNECGFYLWDADSVPLNNFNSCEREVNNV